MATRVFVWRVAMATPFNESAGSAGKCRFKRHPIAKQKRVVFNQSHPRVRLQSAVAISTSVHMSENNEAGTSTAHDKHPPRPRIAAICLRAPIRDLIQDSGIHSPSLTGLQASSIGSSGPDSPAISEESPKNLHRILRFR